MTGKIQNRRFFWSHIYIYIYIYTHIYKYTYGQNQTLNPMGSCCCAYAHRVIKQHNHAIYVVTAAKHHKPIPVYITCNHSQLYYMCTRHTSQCCESSVQVHSTAQDWLDISIDNASSSLLTYIRIEMPIPTKKQYSCTHMCISSLDTTC